ncbi:hypothetical protein OEZ85_008906 [Tetradesmus obliquus]|uniref:ATP-dependent RNA helicase n=1 Tax=Tetradesmus obliquus TaxID=3088 RepID=A0ABY8TK73_TETOB|nr:hypothetical protein OEZ85_008906 [Tetradesmus obliquus]
MHNKNSKRQRKQKASQSLKGKQQAPRLDALDLLGEELQQDVELDEDLGSNALILPAAGAAGGSGKGTAAKQQPEQQLSKSQLKKLRQVQLKKERRQQLGEVLTQLNSSSLPDEQLSLLRPLHQRGARETKKQRLRRLLKLQRAGYKGFEGSDELMQERQVKGVAGSSSSSESDSEGGSSSSDSEDEHQRPAKQARIELAVEASPAAAADAAAGQPSSGSDDEDGEQVQAAGAAAAAAAPAAAAAAAAAADTKAQLKAAKAHAAALKAQARLEATGTTVDEAEAEEAAATRAAAAERAAAAAAGPTRVVSVVRPPEMEEARRQLPILGLEQEVMEGIARHDVVVLCGETGCGKTTQVPQFLLEAGYGCRDFPERAGAIVVTQPRRVAAISTAERVAGELGVALGSKVGYQVRHDRRVGPDSAIRFMTDGVLMRQLQSDFLLRGYSVILLDEAHERSLNTDLLLGMLSRLVPLRRRLHEQWLAAGQPPANTSAAAAAGAAAAAAGGLGPVYPLKLIIMSATLRTSDFTENSRLFARPPPVLSVPARQFPVTIHFAKHTELDDYLATAVRKVCRIHQELPGGGILLFLTGQREVQVAVRRIRQAFAKRTRSGAAAAAAAAGASPAVDAAAEDDEAADAAAAGADAAEIAADAADAALEQDLLDAAAGDAAAAAVDDFDLLEQDEDEKEVQVMGGDSWTPEELAAAEARFEAVYGLSLHNTSNNTQDAGSGGTISQQQGAAAGQQQQRAAAPVHVLPLYAMLPQAQQAAVFQPVPAGHRLIVVATNVAETSITIPGIRYVVDAGRSKQKLLEAHSGAAVARYAVDWVSKAAAEQRAGRAGRTGPGHVYRLFSSAHFNDNFQQHSDPEIANTPLEGVVLLLKAMGVDRVSNFPFPSPPEAEALRTLEVLRRALAAGWCDQVSRRVRSADYVARLASDGRQGRHAVRYSPACLAEEVFLHPRSCLAKTAPEYVVYGDIVRTAKRPYMALVTAIEPQWLADCGSSLCKVSEPLSEPAPFYQPDIDCVLAWHDATYSQHSWQLPRLLLPLPDEPSCAAVFGAALLAGRVLPAAAALAGVLLAPAATAARQELQGLPRVGELLAALQGRKVSCAAG